MLQLYIKTDTTSHGLYNFRRVGIHKPVAFVPCQSCCVCISSTPESLILHWGSKSPQPQKEPDLPPKLFADIYMQKITV